MRFGMGILLTKEEEQILAPITKPCFAALGLANDYYSFDIEWKEFQEVSSHKENPTMTNAVWLYMTWESLSIAEAKQKTRQLVRKYEQDFQTQMNHFIAEDSRCLPKLARYLKALAFQIPGNIVWSLRCPRYHPELCSDAAERLNNSTHSPGQAEDNNTGSEKPDTISSESQDSDSDASTDRSSLGSPKLSHTSVSSLASCDYPDKLDSKPTVQLGTEVRNYISICLGHVLLTLEISSTCLLPLNTLAPSRRRASEKL